MDHSSLYCLIIYVKDIDRKEEDEMGEKEVMQEGKEKEMQGRKGG